jgi:hypothetical protein
MGLTSMAGADVSRQGRASTVRRRLSRRSTRLGRCDAEAWEALDELSVRSTVRQGGRLHESKLTCSRSWWRHNRRPTEASCADTVQLSWPSLSNPAAACAGGRDLPASGKKRGWPASDPRRERGSPLPPAPDPRQMHRLARVLASCRRSPGRRCWGSAHPAVRGQPRPVLIPRSAFMMSELRRGGDGRPIFAGL